MMGLFLSASGVRTGHGCGGEIRVLGDGEGGADSPESEPRMSDINVADVCLRNAKLKKDLNIALWISRFGSL